MKSSIDVSTSNTLAWLRFPLALLIVSIHTPYCVEKNDIAYYLGTLVSRSVADIAVPVFFFMSGFLFFSNKSTFSLGDYVKVLKKKVRTLLVPYLLWNVIAYLMVILGNYFYLHRGLGKVMPWELLKIFWAQDMGYVVKSPLGYDFSLLSAPINGPLWFVRDLMVMMVLSPVIYVIIKKMKYWSAAIFVLPYLLLLGVPVRGLGLAALCFFPMGAYFSLMNIKPILCDSIGGGGRLVFVIVAIILISCSYYCYLFDIDNLIIHQLKRIFCVPLFFIIAQRLSTKQSSSRIIAFGETSFWIYVTHTLPAMHPIMLSLSFFQGIPIIGETLLYLFQIGLKTVICVSLYYFMKHFYPKVLSFAVGGRFAK